MQNHDWIELFRLIPENQHNQLVMTTLSGVDLNIEMIVRTELTYIVFRGRVSGNTDEGRLFFLPYRQIDFLQLNRQLKEADINEILSIKPAPESGIVPAPGSSPAFGPTPAAPKSSYHGTVVPSPASSPHVVPLTPHSPAAVGAPRAPASRPSAAPTLASRMVNVPAAALQPPGVSSRIPNVPAAALVPPPGAGGGNGNEGVAPPQNSILERLRAQRNAIVPPRR